MCEHTHFIPIAGDVTPVAYTVPVVVVLIIALLVMALVVLLVIRMRKRKRARGRSLPHIYTPDPTTPNVMFHKRRTESDQFTSVALLSRNGASNAYSDPLEFPRNRLYVYTGTVLGM